MFSDIRYAVRMLLKNPGFSFIAILTLALGICGVVTQFSVIDAALIRGLPFPDADRLVRVAMREPTWVPERDTNPYITDILDFGSKSAVFEKVAAYWTAGSFIVTIKDTPDRFNGSHVTPGFFSILGVMPAMGRDFVDADHDPNAERVTIISHDFWQSDFAGDPNIIGRQIRLNGKVASVIGVMPRDFRFRDSLWMPMFNETPISQRPGGSAHVLGRLKSGKTLHEGEAEFELFLQQLAKEYPQTNGTYTVARVEPLLHGFIGRPARQLLVTMFAAVIAVLVIACANVMNMQFALAAVRWRELAVRAAMGASRFRLIRQMITECLLLALLGAVAGILMSHWALGVFGAVLGAVPGQSMPSWLNFRIDHRAMGFAVLAMIGAVILSGLLPAILASRSQILDALKESGRGYTSGVVRRLNGLLVVGQISLTCALLICSLLLIKSIRNQFALDLGIDPSSVLSGRMNFESEYREAPARLAAIRRILDQMRSSPTITHAAFTTRRNMMTTDYFRFFIDGKSYPEPNTSDQAWLEVVSDGYFETMGLKPLEGREFEPGDSGDRGRVALVNQSFARKFFPGQSAIGRRIKTNSTDPGRTILGVVPDTLMQGPVDKTRDGAGLFIPIAAEPATYLTLVVRGRLPADQLGSAMRRELMAVEPRLPIYNLGTPERFFAAALAQPRTLATLFTLFASVSVILAAVGLYGVMAFAVSRRTQEIGIRMSLGAQRGQIMRMVLLQGGLQAIVGTVLGIALSLVIVQYGQAVAASFLYKVNPRDPLIYSAVIVLLAGAALLACLVPARRASRVDPMVALRSE